MAMTMHVDIVSAEEAIFSGPAERVFASAIMGEVCILPRHTPFLTQLKPGEVRVITPDGELGLTAGSGQGGAPDADALTIIDLTVDPIRTVGYLTLDSGPESFEVSPDGRLVAVVLMNGSNLAADDPNRTESGIVTLLARRGKTFETVQHLVIGRIPEGVAFTADGQHLVVQCHSSRQLWIFRVAGEKIIDTAHRVDVPGMPSSIRAVKGDRKSVV